MTRAPLLRLGAADGGSRLTVLGVDADDRDADLADPEDAYPEETDAIRCGIQELPRRRDIVDRCGGGISRTNEFPRSMCARTASRVRPGALHQRRRPAVLLRAGGGGGPSYAASSRSFLRRKNAVHAWRLSGLKRGSARCSSLMHALDDLVDGGVEGGARWRRRDRDAAHAQTPSSGHAEVGRRRVAHRVEQPALPLVQGVPAEMVVGRTIVV
jgi:hypothetical protein